MKIIAFYLPQFHEIPENNKWWGEGFTEWVNMKKSQPLFDKHYQPRIPLNNNYYNLLDYSIQKWQIEIAKQHHIYGFCFYHYWFNGKLLLEKPVENFLNDKTLDFNFCLSWANEPWTNAWVSRSNKVLMQQTYGDEHDWKKHFEYFLPFFLDKRYITQDDKPILIIYRPDLIGCLKSMLKYWNMMAKKSGLNGITYVYQHPKFHFSNSDKSMFDYGIEYQPSFALFCKDSIIERKIRQIKMNIFDVMNKIFKGCNQRKKKIVEILSYDDIWKSIINYHSDSNNMFPGAFVDWDNTPRRGMNGLVVQGASPEKFRNYLEKQIINAKQYYKKDIIFLFAWNEWTEGGYLEPDEKYEYKYLSVIKEVLEEENENEYF